jgi:hypothetical protein
VRDVVGARRVEDVRAQGVPVDGDPRSARGDGGQQEQRENDRGGAMSCLRRRHDTMYDEMRCSRWGCAFSHVHVLDIDSTAQVLPW